ncbi:LysM peptidoglycan-binding domain-containing protein [Flavobacterium amniphilum]|uniref:LysM peptidoglycan-binding domain-containing protein n=1 Tax=Flavobacterium amniphilum TaxID=1834035 RepID=UPI00202A862A|nr:LysM peptidoglycan-binding domain-containing protein [Flavobacterium amniphilum]MCL9806882.1 LysM peptidoglycan-binding domain-containing protein [Flavobacterium amniphilum]
MKHFLLLFLGMSQLVLAQQEKSFKHTVTTNETITQIAKKYNISEKEILKLNPGAENGLQENTQLLIPNNNSISYLLKKSDIKAVEYKKHQVLSKETLYGISRQHNVTIEALQNANPDLLTVGLKEGQTLNIPEGNEVAAPKKETVLNGNVHEVQPKETLFSIARLYNVSVKDLDALNAEVLKEGLKIGMKIAIPNKKKTISGQARIINNETIFHVVQAKETKYSISKKYGITIEQLELQNPEIINGLTEGNKLAINKSMLKAKNENEELMIALAEKQAVVEKSKAQNAKIEDLEDRLTVQKELNKKMITLNKLNINLNAIDETKTGSVEKLRLILDANKKIQDVLIGKLDSLASTMERDLADLKEKDVETLEESKKLEKESYQNIIETDKLITGLKRDLAENRKIYSGIMQKVHRITVQENQEYKKKVRANLSDKDLASIEEINKLSESQLANEKKNDALLAKVETIDAEKKNELKRKISKATFYGSEAREYDDKLAQVKLQRYQKTVEESKKDVATTTEAPEATEIRKQLNENVVDEKNPTKIEVIRNLKGLEDGFYIVAKVFEAAAERDAFAIQLTDAGETKTSFFYNVNTLSYYVYTKIFQTADEAIYEYKTKVNNPLFEHLFIVQISKEQ